MPLLVFPSKKNTTPNKGHGGGSNIQIPSSSKQVERLGSLFDDLNNDFLRYKASLSSTHAGLAPEMVLVLEIAGSIEDFKNAIDKTDGLDWLAEWDLEDSEPDDNFFSLNENGKKSKVSNRLFVSMANEQGMHELLTLWSSWKNGDSLPRGKTKWRDVFSQLRTIRRWGIQDMFVESGVLDYWLENLSADDNGSETFQVEFFYSEHEDKRRESVNYLKEILQRVGGELVSHVSHIPEIHFHAVKANAPTSVIRGWLDIIERGENEIEKILFHTVMYVRPAAQSMVAAEDGGEVFSGNVDRAEDAPVGALIDGYPLSNHQLLSGSLDICDIFDVESAYQSGERTHGTAMASLILHGDLSANPRQTLTRKLLCIPVMQPNPNSSDREEHVPESEFLEDRIHVAVRKMFEPSQGEMEALYPNIRVINLSIGESFRCFEHTPSPCARLLDWLSWKYRVLFCVSSGNFQKDIDLQVNEVEWNGFTDDEKVRILLSSIQDSLAKRRLLSPAESINALTIGALHRDESVNWPLANRLDLAPVSNFISPINRIGWGFRRSIKPEIYFPGGRQLYQKPASSRTTQYKLSKGALAPGLSAATDSINQNNHTTHSRGTSNATALATRAAVQIYDVLQELRNQGQSISPQYEAVLMKTLLVHGARQLPETKTRIGAHINSLGTTSRQRKKEVARFLGYGAPVIERVLKCTEQRATVIGCDEIHENEAHEYEFPIPSSLSGQQYKRWLTVTLSWFTPINPKHRNLREAKLSIEATHLNAENTPLYLSRMDADHNQVLRGTVQHEVFEGDAAIKTFVENNSIKVRVVCKKDAVSRLDEAIPYGLAVTLEVEEGINVPIYQQVKQAIQTRVSISS